MTAALASNFKPLPELDSLPKGFGAGVQSLLAPKRGRPSYGAQGAAAALYLAALAAIFAYTAPPKETVPEEPIELVMMPAEPAVEPPPLVEEEPPPPLAEAEPEPEPEPPPPALEPEPVAPVQPKPPAPVKKVVEHKPPVERKPVAEHKPATPQKPAAPQKSARPAAAPAAQPKPNAIPSDYANRVHARIAGAAGSAYPTSLIGRHQGARVAYRLVIGPSGMLISKSLTPSGNPAFDAAAAQVLSRAGPFPATGMASSVALSGAIAFPPR